MSEERETPTILVGDIKVPYVASPTEHNYSWDRPARAKNNRSSTTTRHTTCDTGYTVALADLLFTPERDFLVKNIDHKVRVDDLRDKTIVLYIVPLYEFGLSPGDNLDMVQAYNELSPLGGVEFVSVPVDIDYSSKDQYPQTQTSFASKEAIFNHLFTTLPWPAVPFSDVEACGGRVAKTFSVDNPDLPRGRMPFWAVIDPTGKVVATRGIHSCLFKLFGGAELHPLSLQRICTLWDEYDKFGECTYPGHGIRYGYRPRCKSRKRLINKWDQLLASPTRDFLLSSNGDQVPISSLKGKVIGLYFCENIPHPPKMKVIKEVYEDAKSRGYDFEIVQINFHYVVYHTVGFSVRQRYQDVNWLTLPFGDPSCRKLQRIFKCQFDEKNHNRPRDRLVTIDARQADVGGFDFEFCADKILDKYGIEGYPFTRRSLSKKVYRTLKNEFQLQSFFPPGLCHLIRPAGDGFDLTDDSQLIGKRVLVLFTGENECESFSPFLSLLDSKYRQQLFDEEEENKFEVVYVYESHFDNYPLLGEPVFSEFSFTKCIKDMPWLVHPSSMDFGKWCSQKIFKDVGRLGTRVAAFDINGELIAKECFLDTNEMYEYNHEFQFPFVSQDLEGWARRYVVRTCQMDWCHIGDCS